MKTPPAQSPDEVFDVVDENDRVIGQATRAEVHAKKLFHRAVHILVFDTAGRVLLQKRSMAKDTCPGLFSTSCAGHVDAGERYENAAARELREELGIDVPENFFRENVPLLRLPPRAETGREHTAVYGIGNFSGTLSPNPAEIDSVKWAFPKDVDATLEKTPELFAESFRFVWNSLCRGILLESAMQKIRERASISA